MIIIIEIFLMKYQLINNLTNVFQIIIRNML